ncbi:MAG: HAD family phosphatase [Pseudomonadota bacterium]
MPDLDVVGTRFEALVFDCDGVYAKNSENLAFEVVADHVNRFIEPRGANQEYDAERMMRDYAGKHFTHIQEGVEADTGIAIPDSMDDEITRDIVTKLKTNTQTDPHLRRLISTFEEGGAAIGMASSSAHARLDAVIHATGTRHILDRKRLDNVVSAADDCDAPKPDPASYLLIAEKLGVDPERCLTIEDSTSGVKAGVAAGIMVIGYLGADHIDPAEKEAHGKKLLEAGATVLVDDMGEIIKMKPKLEQMLTEKLAQKPPTPGLTSQSRGVAAAPPPPPAA